MNAKVTIMALAVFALAVAGIAFVDVADADDAPVQTAGVTTVTIDVAQGVMTLTTDGLLTPDEVRAVALDLEDASYAIPLTDMTTDLTIATLADYEAVKPYLSNGLFRISVAEVMDIGTEKWLALQRSLSNLNVDVSKVSTIVSVPTPVAVYQAGETAIAEKDAQIASMLTQEQADAKVAEAVAAATAGLFTQEQLDQAVADALANVSDYQYTQEQLDAKVAEAVATATEKATADTIGQFLTAEQIAAVKEKIAAKERELAKAVAVMDKTQDEADKELADYTKTAYKDAISADAVAEKDKTIADLNEQLANATKGERPIYETGIGQCLIIVLVFLALLVVWFTYRQGYLARILPKKKIGGKE